MRNKKCIWAADTDKFGLCAAGMAECTNAGTVCKETNADRIRAMSDEELSEWILKNVDCGKEGVMCTKSANSCNGRCRKNRLDWLRQPAKED